MAKSSDKGGMDRRLIVGLGLLAALGLPALWHGPLGAGDRLAATIETTARATLDHYEMGRITARLERAPLTRRLRLSGPADSFQRRELVRILSEIPGVGEVTWDPHSLPMEPTAALPAPALPATTEKR